MQDLGGIVTISRTRLWASLSLAVVAAAMLLPSTGCSGTPTETSDSQTGEGLTIVATVPPMKWLVEQVGGDSVEAIVMVESGEDPHTYEPSPDELRLMSEADAYVEVGLEFEDVWLPRFSATNPEMVIIDATTDVEPLVETRDHTEGDPHVWTSPTDMKLMAASIADEFAALDPDNTARYEENLAALTSEIDTLDGEISSSLASADSRTFMVFHPAWGYFARDYGLEQVPVEVGGQEPSAAELAGLIDLAIAENITAIFVQPSTSTRTASVIAEQIGAEIVVIDPLAEEWIENMYAVAEAFEEALTQ